MSRFSRFTLVSIVSAQLLFGVFGVPFSWGGSQVLVSTAYAAHAKSSDAPRYSSSVARKVKKLPKSIVKKLPIPVALGVEVADLTDTWGAARSGGRTHEGVDILAPRGTPIASPTKSVVTWVGEGELGGTVVYTANPGGETFYYAHLDRVADGVKPGLVLEVGDLIGYVGNTGNASTTVTHLHFGIYKRGAHNPFPRLTKTLTAEERLKTTKQALAETKKHTKKKGVLVRGR